MKIINRESRTEPLLDRLKQKLRHKVQFQKYLRSLLNGTMIGDCPEL